MLAFLWLVHLLASSLQISLYTSAMVRRSLFVASTKAMRCPSMPERPEGGFMVSALQKRGNRADVFSSHYLLR
jgi:hypothetical protein